VVSSRAGIEMNRRALIVLAIVACWFAFRFTRDDARTERPPESPLLVIAVQPIPTSDAELPRAEDVLAQMASAYASCASYRDEGVVWAEFHPTDEGDSPHHRETQFSTRFDRQRSLRFEYLERERWASRDNRMVIWGTPSDAHMWWTVGNGKLEAGGLHHLRGAAAGVSSLSSVLIPDLLYPDEGRDPLLLRLVDPIVRGRDDVGGRTCYRIDAQSPRSQTYTLWIDASQFLLRRMHTTLELDRCMLDETYVFAPTLDAPISDDELAFTPPQ
jgi:hypothetical protein